MIELKSDTIQLRFVEESDAEFILQLRMDKRYNQFLSSTSSDIQSQKEWIGKYKEKEAKKTEFYFIIERLDGTPCGTVRIYDLRPESFCWGSWILNENKTKFSALESAFLVYLFGFSILGYEKSHFDVMKGNEKVISFHERMGAIRVGEDEKNLYFEITKESVAATKEKWIRKLQ